jgi:hypothetical protein
MAPLPSPPPHVLSGSFVLNRDSPQAQGLVVWWELGTNEGTRLRDLSGKTQLGTLAGGYEAHFDDIGRSLTLDGTTQEATVTVPLMNTWPVDGFMVSCWFKQNSSVQYGRIMEKGTNGEIVLNVYETTANRPSLVTRLNETKQLEGTSDINDGKWHHIVGAGNFNGTRLYTRLYVDGLLQASGDSLTGSSPATAPIYLGRYGGGNFKANGWLRDARWYIGCAAEKAVVESYYPDTRYDLYAAPRRKTYYMPTAAPTTYPSRLLLLGVG